MMHGLVNRAIEGFVRITYGDALWNVAASAAGVDSRGIVLMRQDETGLTDRLMKELSCRLDRSPRDLAEDVGAWVARLPSIRRLLRFAGSDFAAFMMALPELDGRARMVVRGFELPRLTVTRQAGGWRIASDCEPIWLHAIVGMLHAMADDYGVLAVIALEGRTINVVVPLADFSAGRPFSFSDPTVGAA